MSSIKLILFKGKTYSDNTHPIMLQYTNNGKIKRKVLHRCLASEWDSKNDRVRGKAKNAAVINSYIAEAYSEAEKQHFKILNGESTSISFFEASQIITVRQAIEDEKERLKKMMKPTPYRQLQSYIDQMAELVDSPVSHCNIIWFNSLIDTFKKLGNSPSTLEKKVKHVRRIIAKHSAVELTKDIKALRFTAPKPVKQKLTLDEIDKLLKVELKAGSNMEIARDVFILQIFLRGVRIGDLLQATVDQFADGRFNYTADKTGKSIGIKLVPQADQIINKYKGTGPRLFPLFDWEYDPELSNFENERRRLKHKESCTSLVNNNLKKLAEKVKIKKPISTHIARHTFARMALDKINNPMITMELLGHSSLAIHQRYLNDIRKDDVLDAAADEIFALPKPTPENGKK